MPTLNNVTITYEEIERLKKNNEIYQTVLRETLGEEEYEAFREKMDAHIRAQAKKYAANPELLRKRMNEVFAEEDAETRH